MAHGSKWLNSQEPPRLAHRGEAGSVSRATAHKEQMSGTYNQKKVRTSHIRSSCIPMISSTPHLLKSGDPKEDPSLEGRRSFVPRRTGACSTSPPKKTLRVPPPPPVPRGPGERRGTFFAEARYLQNPGAEGDRGLGCRAWSKKHTKNGKGTSASKVSPSVVPWGRNKENRNKRSAPSEHLSRKNQK